MKIRRILSAILGAVCLLALCHFASPRRAEASCLSWWQSPIGQQCLVYSPDPPAGAHACVAGEPGPMQVTMWSGSGSASFTGYCVTLNSSPSGAAGSTEPNAAADHWYFPYPIGSIKVGSDPSNQGYIYQGAAPNFGAGWYLPAGYAGDIYSLSIHCVMAR